MATNTVNFFQPGTEQAIDMRQVQRQRELADLLRQQGQTSPQGQMVSGHYVAPGKGAYVAQLANALFGNLASRRADEQEREMGQRIKTAREKESNDFLAALSGTPGQPARDIQPLTPNDDEGNPMPVARADAIPGMPADQNKALGIGMRSDNPTLQALAAKLMEQKMQDAAFESAFGAGAGGGAPGGAPAAGGAPAGPGGMLGAEAPMPGAAQGGAGKFLGEGFGQVPAGLARLAFRKDPAEVAKMVMEARKPVALREGDFIAPNGAGGVQSLYSQPKLPAGMVPTRDQSGAVTGAKVLPNFSEGNAAIAGAEAQAKEEAAADNALQTIDIPGVGPVTKTRAQWKQQAVGGQRPATPVQGANIPTAPSYAAALRNLPAAQPGMSSSFEGPPEQVLPLIAGIKDPQERSNAYEAYSRQMTNSGATGGASMAPRGVPSVAGGGIIGQDKAAQEYDTTRAKDFAKAAADYQDKARGAGGMLRNLDTLEQLYKDPNVVKGGMAESISGLKNIGASLGVETKGLGAEQAIEAITNKMALDARSTAEGGGMPGAMSDADRNFLKAQQPGLSKTPEGRAAIIANARKVAQRQVQVAQMANEYERTNGRLDAGFDRMVADFAAQNPMFADQKPATGATPAAATPDLKTLAAQELARRRAKNGG